VHAADQGAGDAKDASNDCSVSHPHHNRAPDALGRAVDAKSAFDDLFKF